MALFNAVRRYIEPHNRIVNDTGKHDGIVVVGDGNTPRTAAMFAYRMRGWKCYSVDPAMDKGQSERSKGWADVSNLVTVRNKIENVRISLRQAIVVLAHAHVTLDQALSAVQAERVCGVVALPCCNWYSLQETLLDHEPDLVYDDFSILSDHREIRLWIGDRTLLTSGTLALRVWQGCVQKELVATTNTVSEVATDMTVEKVIKRHDGVLDFMHDMLRKDSSDAMAFEHSAEDDAMDTRLRSAVASHLGTDAFVLVFDRLFRHSTVRLLLQEGYTNVYTIGIANERSMTAQSHVGTKSLMLQLFKATANGDHHTKDGPLRFDPCGHFLLQSSLAKINSSKQVPDEETITASFENDGQLPPPISCVFDMGTISRGLRGRPKKSKPSFFRRLYRTLDQLVSVCRPLHSVDNTTGSASLVCLTPHKHWRQREYFAHADLGYDVQSLGVTHGQSLGTPMFIFCCSKSSAQSSSAVTVKSKARADDACASDAALTTWFELKKKLSERQSELLIAGTLAIVDSGNARFEIARDREQEEAKGRETRFESPRKYVQVMGTLSRIRRFSTGMAFLSLELGISGENRPLQVFLQMDTMGLSLSAFDQVTRLLRKGDELVALGFMARNAHGKSMLKVEAMSMARSEKFQALN